MCLLGFVCRSINLQIFTEISRFFYMISLQIFGVLRLRGLLSKLAAYCFDLFFKASQLSNKLDAVIGLIFLYALYVHASNKMTKDHNKTSLIQLNKVLIMHADWVFTFKIYCSNIISLRQRFHSISAALNVKILKWAKWNMFEFFDDKRYFSLYFIISDFA